MNIGRKILSRLGYHKGTPVSWFSFTGDCNSAGFTIKLDDYSDLRDAYCRCSPVSTIINRLASSMANGKWWILDEKDNDASKHHKEVWKLLNKPNPLQTRTELIKQLDIYRNLYGVTYLYAVVPSGFSSVKDADTLWAINPERIETVYRKNTIFFASDINDIIEKYVITIDGKTIDVEPAHILTIRDSFSDVCDHFDNSHISRISGLEYEIKNIIQAQEAIFSLNNDRGALGILSNKTKDVSGSIPLTSNEKQRIQDDYQRAYGLSERQSKIIISDSDLGWQPMSFNVRDLMLFEGITQNTKSIASAFNYPHGLFANENETYKNRPEDIKYLYQDNVIPVSSLYAEKITAWFEIERARIDIDFSHIAYLKEDEARQAEARLKRSQSLQIDYQMGIITLEEYRRLQDMDEKPEGSTFYTSEDGNKENTSN